MSITLRTAKIFSLCLLALGLSTLFPNNAKADRLFPPFKGDTLNVCDGDDQLLIWDKDAGKNKCTDTFAIVNTAACPPNQYMVHIVGGNISCVGYAPAGISCPDGQFMTGIDASGAPICAAKAPNL